MLPQNQSIWEETSSSSAKNSEMQIRAVHRKVEQFDDFRYRKMVRIMSSIVALFFWKMKNRHDLGTAE